MTKIQNPNVWGIEYWNLRFVCNLVFVVCDLLLFCWKRWKISKILSLPELHFNTPTDGFIDKRYIFQTGRLKGDVAK